MHEFGIAESIMKSTLGKMKEHNIERVDFIKVRVGKLNMLTRESLQNAFDLVSKETPLAGARLEMEEVEGGEISIVEFASEG